MQKNKQTKKTANVTFRTLTHGALLQAKKEIHE